MKDRYIMASDSKQTISVNEVVVQGVLSVINNQTDSIWTGTMTQLRSNLKKALDRKQSQMLPRSPSALRVVMNRVANRLRARGISVKFARTTDHTRTRFVKFAR
jgi:hypothetical protein